MTRGSTVLVVEDEAGVRTVVRRVLARAGYLVLDAADALEAQRIASEFAGPIDLVLCDVVLPGVLTSRELIDALLLQHADMVIIMMSGYTRDEVMDRGMTPRNFEFLEKPFTPPQLLAIVSAALTRD